MSEIYWITRLDMINGWLIVFSVVSCVLLTALCSVYLIMSSELHDTKKSTLKRALRASMITFFICLLLSIFTPTKNEAFMIWGVGSTIDYIQDNEIIQQLPDKCVDALDAWVESLNEEEEK